MTAGWAAHRSALLRKEAISASCAARPAAMRASSAACRAPFHHPSFS